MIDMNTPGMTVPYARTALIILGAARGVCLSIREMNGPERDDMLRGCWMTHYSAHRDFLAEEADTRGARDVRALVVFRVLQGFFEHGGDWSAAIAELEYEIAQVEKVKYNLETIEGARNA